MSTQNRDDPSPCFRCETKNYAAGCSAGCVEREEWHERQQTKAKENHDKYRATEFLKQSARKRAKSARNSRGEVI